MNETTAKTIAVAVVMAALCGPALGQAGAKPVPCAPPPTKDVAGLQVPALEVVSVKQHKADGASSSGGMTADGLAMSNMPLALMIQLAYGAEFMVGGHMTGIPPWASAERYDIVGKVSDADAGKLTDPCRRNLLVRPILRAVLEERFHVQVHHESNEIPAYALVVAKSGVRMKESTPGEMYTAGIAGPDGRPSGPGAVSQKSDAITGQGISMGALAPVLSPGAGRIVIDKTGLTGRYDVALHWVPDQPTPGDGAAAADNGPSLFTAVQEQLGLRLEPTKTAIEVYVVDRVERPTEN